MKTKLAEVLFLIFMLFYIYASIVFIIYGVCVRDYTYTYIGGISLLFYCLIDYKQKNKQS